jgi:hypothetical protein
LKSFRKIQFSWFNYCMHPFCNTTASSKHLQSVRDMHMVKERERQRKISLAWMGFFRT